MREEFHGFNRTIDKLNHSFIKEVEDYGGISIDFQHPSIRDLLLNYLNEEPIARKQYISKLSIRGITSIIEGIAAEEKRIEDTPHNLRIKTEDEFGLLCERIESIMNDTVEYSDFIKLIFSSRGLLPREEKRILEPSEIDLKDFMKTNKGRLIAIFTNVMSKKSFYESKPSYTISGWFQILKQFYKICTYVKPIPRLEYLSELLNQFQHIDWDNKVYFLGILYENEILYFKQLFTKEIDENIFMEIEEQLKEKLSEGDQYQDEDYFESPGDIEEYDNWEYDTDDLINISKIFFNFSSKEIPEELRELENLKASIEAPEIGDFYDEDFYREELYEAEYWTIEKIFEDL
jgi:hypothetical protein